MMLLEKMKCPSRQEVVGEVGGLLKNCLVELPKGNTLRHLSWETFGNSLEELFGETFLGNSLGKLSRELCWRTLLDNSFANDLGELSWKICWETIFEISLGPWPWEPLLGTSLGKLSWKLSWETRLRIHLDFFVGNSIGRSSRKSLCQK